MTKESFPPGSIICFYFYLCFVVLNLHLYILHFFSYKICEDYKGTIQKFKSEYDFFSGFFLPHSKHL